MLYITSPGLLYFINANLYLLTFFIQLTQSLVPDSGNHQYVLCICEFSLGVLYVYLFVF